MENFLEEIHKVDFEPSYKLTNKDGAIICMFNHLKANRTLKEKKVAAIKNAMKEGEYLPPIIVAYPSLTVVEGNHRFRAAMECLKSEIPFVLRVNLTYELDNKELLAARVLNNTQTKWNMKDILHSYCTEGNKNYLALKELMSFCPLAKDITIALLLAANNRSKVSMIRQFNNGQLSLSKEDIADAYKMYNELIKLSEIYQDNCVFNANHIVTWAIIRHKIDEKFYNRLIKSYKTKSKRLDFFLPSKSTDWKTFYIDYIL